MRLSANDGSSALQVSATWCPTAGKSGSNVSLQSKSKPGRFLRHFGTQLVAAEKGVIGDFDHACNYEANTTWKIDGPNTPALADKGAGENCGDLGAFTVSDTRDHLMQAREGGMSYSSVSGSKATTVTGPVLSPWNNMNEFAVGREGPTRDYLESAVAVERSSGKLWEYRGIKTGATTRTEVGVGTNWNQMRELTMGAYCGGSFVRGENDLVAVERSTGKVWCYGEMSSNAPVARRQIHEGWQNVRAIAGGEFSSQNILTSDLITLNSNGNAFLYSANALGDPAPTVKIINDWSNYVNIVGGQ